MTLEEQIEAAVAGAIDEQGSIGQVELRRIARRIRVTVGHVRFVCTMLERRGAIVIRRLRNLDHQPVEIARNLLERVKTASRG